MAKASVVEKEGSKVYTFALMKIRSDGCFELQLAIKIIRKREKIKRKVYINLSGLIV
jgi:hypothetical protein